MAIGCVTAVGTALLVASPVAASPLLAGPAIVHQQTQNVEIEKKYVEWGGAGSPLGNPVGEVYVVGNGFGQDYDGGAIYYSTDTGAKVMYGVILDKYRELGGPAGEVGFPSVDEADATGGINRVSEFKTPGGAKIFWTPEAGAWLVRGPILAAWDKLGGAGGPIGYPIAAETEVDGVRVAKFSGNGGTAEIRWSEADGFVTVPPELAASLEGLQIPGVPAVSVPSVAVSVPSVDVDIPDVEVDVDAPDVDVDGGINKWWAVPVGLAIAAGAGGLLGLLGRRRKGDINVAGVKGPKIDGPDLKAPKLKAPDVDLPKVKAPDVRVPKHEAPDLNLPDVDLPDAKAPKISGGAVAGVAGVAAAGAAGLGGKLSGSDKDIDVDLPNADVNAPKLAGGLDVDAPNVGLSGAGKVAGGLTAAGLGAGALTWLGSKKGGSDANLEAVYGGLGGADDIDVSYEEVVTGIPAAAVGGVKFLVDENLSPKVASLLRDAGYDAIHVFDADLRGGNNDQVLARATADGRTLITAELSYVDDLIASQSGPSVLLLRRGGATIEEQASVLLASIPKVAPALGSGALASLGMERIRVRSLPLRRG